MTKVFVRNGMWRDQNVEKMEFNLVSDGVMVGKNGFYVTVDGKPLNSNTKNVRIYIKNRDEVKIASEEIADISEESDEDVDQIEGDFGNESEHDAISRIEDRFAVLEEMTVAATEGVIRSIIVEGSPGAGKSYNVENSLRMKNIFNKDTMHEFIRGTISAIGLYKKLYEYRDAGKVLVLDDCDSVFYDQVALSILKAALDSTPRRVISWNTNSLDLKDSGIPNRFEFLGAVIFITNMNFDNSKSKQLKPHFDAIISRSHYLNLTIRTKRDKYLRIKSMVKNGNMLDAYGIDEATTEEILDFIKENIDSLRELSLRTTIKIADIVKMKPNAWRRICKMTVCK